MQNTNSSKVEETIFFYCNQVSLSAQLQSIQLKPQQRRHLLNVSSVKNSWDPKPDWMIAAKQKSMLLLPTLSRTLLQH